MFRKEKVGHDLASYRTAPAGSRPVHQPHQLVGRVEAGSAPHRATPALELVA